MALSLAQADWLRALADRGRYDGTLEAQLGQALWADAWRRATSPQRDRDSRTLGEAQMARIRARLARTAEDGCPVAGPLGG